MDGRMTGTGERCTNRGRGERRPLTPGRLNACPGPGVISVGERTRHPVDEQEIIEGCLRESPVASRAMVEAYGNLVLSVALNVIGNRQDAEDVCQETFLQVFRRLDRYDRERSFKTWLLTIAYRRSLDMLRKKRRFSEFSSRAKFEPAVTGRGGDPHPGRSRAPALGPPRAPVAEGADRPLPLGERRLHRRGHRRGPDLFGLDGPRLPFQRPPQDQSPLGERPWPSAERLSSSTTLFP